MRPSGIVKMCCQNGIRRPERLDDVDVRLQASFGLACGLGRRRRAGEREGEDDEEQPCGEQVADLQPALPPTLAADEPEWKPHPWLSAQAQPLIGRHRPNPRALNPRALNPRALNPRALNPPCFEPSCFEPPCF